MSLLHTHLAHHVEVITKLQLLRVFIWPLEQDKIRIGCKFGQNKDVLILVLVSAETTPLAAIAVNIPSTIQLDIETSQVVIKEGVATCTFKISFENDRSSYMWSSIHPHADPLPSEAIKSISCRVCLQPVFKQPCKIEKYVFLPSNSEFPI